MAIVSDIVNADSFVGNAANGGFGGKAIKIDSRPLELLASYTFLYNKSQYDQRQKDADEKIKELASITALDLNGTRPEDRDKVLSQYEQLMKDAAARASEGSPKSPREKAEQKLKFDLKTKETIDAINAVNARAISYTDQKGKIVNDTTLSAKQKEVQLSQLDKLFNDTDIKAPIPKLEKFQLKVPEIGKPLMKTVGTLVKNQNGIIDQTIGFFDPETNMNASLAEANDLILPPLPANATQIQKNEYEQKKASLGTNGIWQDAAAALNAALSDGKYKKEDGTIDLNAVKADNPIASNILELANRWNDYAEKGRADAVAGMYTDQMGNQISLLDIVSPDDFFTIDINKPLSAEQIIFLQKFGDAAPDTKQSKYQFTGEANTRLNILTDAETQRRGQANQLKIAQLPYEQIKLSSGSGSKTVSEQPYNPLASIIASIGSLNKGVPLSDLSQAQIAAINPNYLDEDGKVKSEFANKQISVGVGNDGNFTLFELGEGGTVKDRRVKGLNESKLLSNAASWLSTGAKERKGQDAYLFDEKIFISAIGKNEQDKEVKSENADDKLTDAEYFIKYKKFRTK